MYCTTTFPRVSSSDWRTGETQVPPRDRPTTHASRDRKRSQQLSCTSDTESQAASADHVSGRLISDIFLAHA